MYEPLQAYKWRLKGWVYQKEIFESQGIVLFFYFYKLLNSINDNKDAVYRKKLIQTH